MMHLMGGDVMSTKNKYISASQSHIKLSDLPSFFLMRMLVHSLENVFIPGLLLDGATTLGHYEMGQKYTVL